jgi:ligand-binding sensor domain-containing protein
LFALILNFGKAQTPSFNFQKLGSEEGLNNSNIFNIEQHQNGLMYFTTQNGIYFYDGYKFDKLSIDSLKSNALLNVSLKNSAELLLSIRDEGISNFNLKTKKYQFESNLKYANAADNFIITDKFAYLLTTQIRIVIIDLATGKKLPDEFKKSKKDDINQAFCLFKTADNRILVGRTDGLYDATDGVQTKMDVLKGSKINSITQSKDGKLIIGSSGKLYILNNNKIETVITPKYKNKGVTFQLGGEKSISKVISDDYGRIWFTSYPDENLYLYQNEITYDVFDILGIPPTLINCIYKDKQQNIWVGTYSDGVYFLQNPFFNSINFNLKGKVLNVNEVYFKQNLLFAATSNGLFGLNVNNYQTKILSHPDEFITEPINGISEINGIIYYFKRSQFDMSQSIFSDSKKIYRFKPIIVKQFLPLENNKSIVADWQANILLCNGDASKTLDTLISFPDYRVSVNALLKDNDSLFVATSTGFFVYDFKSKKYHNVVSPELNYKINDIALINGKLYAAHEAGITDVRAKKLIQQIGNLRLNGVKKIKEFNGQIWLATLDGVFICDKDLQPVKLLNKSTGLPSNSINDITLNEQNVCISTARGISIATLKDITGFDPVLKPVVINYIYVDGKNLNTSSDTVTLGSDQSDISIYFYSPYFNKPSKQYYRYRRDNGEWKIIENTSFELGSIEGGKHKIEIAASSDNISWSQNAVVLIKKEEKLTETQWIYWLFTIGGLLLISGISFVWVKRVKIKATKRLQEEQQVNLLKHQAMNALLSPHFIFNSLTSIQNYINTNNSLKASEYLAKFSRLIRMIIEKASQSDITLNDEIARLTYYLELEKERFKNKFDYVINLDEQLNGAEIKIPNMIIQPHVENCIIHGILPKQSHGTLYVTFKRESKTKLLITIEDDGIGLMKAKEHAKTGHKSLGTSTIKTILEINSKLTGKSQKVTMLDKSTVNPKDSGTKITIELEQ